MTDLKQLTIRELKKFISEHRTNDDMCSAALCELLSRDSDGIIYPANMPREKMERVLQQKLDQVKRSQH